MIQKPVLFSVSVDENIAYGLLDEHVSRDDVIQASKAANAHDFITSVPQATRALDAVSERLVQDARNRMMKGRTSLVIAHRLSTVQNADQIALFSNGRIAELGTLSCWPRRANLLHYLELKYLLLSDMKFQDIPFSK